MRLALLSLFFLLGSTAFADDRIIFTMPTNKIHEIVVSICQRAPCEGNTDQEKVDWMASHLKETVLAFPSYYHSLSMGGVTVTLQPEHEGIY